MKNKRYENIFVDLIAFLLSTQTDKQRTMKFLLGNLKIKTNLAFLVIISIIIIAVLVCIHFSHIQLESNTNRKVCSVEK